MSPTLLPRPISRSSGPLPYDPAPTCLFSSLRRRFCKGSLQRLRRYMADFAYSPACPDTLPRRHSRLVSWPTVFEFPYPEKGSTDLVQPPDSAAAPQLAAPPVFGTSRGKNP